MKNIPLFTAGGSVGTLILSEVPGKQKAYLALRAVASGGPAGIISEALDFSRAVGGKELFVRSLNGAAPLSAGPLERLSLEPACELWRFCRALEPPFPPGESLEPLGAENAEAFISIHNRCFFDVSCSVTYTRTGIAPLLSDSPPRSAYIWRVGGQCAGILELDVKGPAGGLSSIAVLPEFRGGAGRRLVLTAMSILGTQGFDSVELKVSSDNPAALRLYERLGFIKGETAEIWLRVRKT